jgi:histidyl-tRNA synthetase
MKIEQKTSFLSQTVRGTHDFLPKEAEQLTHFENLARNIFKRFGYSEIRTPNLEFVALFERALGQTTDIVQKEMFVMEKEDQLICLRPEGTAGVVRSLIEHNLTQQSPIVKLFYMGPMFRAERPQTGRYRQFLQIGCEAFGNAAPSIDAQTILLVSEILRAFGITNLNLQLNTLGCTECRPQYKEKLLEFLKTHHHKLCQDCQKRMERNPFRALDCKKDREHLKDAPQTLDSICSHCLNHHNQVLNFLNIANQPIQITPTLVRGLDYYNRTVFEVYVSGKTGSQDALAAGGRYDSLVQQLGGHPTPAVGFALGVERVLNFVNQNVSTVASQKKKNLVFVSALGPIALAPCFKLLQDLRKNGIASDGLLNQQSLKSQMRFADSLGARFCIIVGDNELKDHSVTLRDMENQSQKNIPMADLVEVLKKARLDSHNE